MKAFAYLTAVVLVAVGIGVGVCSSSWNHSTTAAQTIQIPPGVISTQHACRLVVGGQTKGFFVRVSRVHLVLTTYAKGEPVESGGDISTGLPANTLVWVVEVHAYAINWNHSTPAGYEPPKLPYTDFSVVMDASTGHITDLAECRCWPLPLSSVGTLISLPVGC